MNSSEAPGGQDRHGPSGSRRSLAPLSLLAWIAVFLLIAPAAGASPVPQAPFPRIEGNAFGVGPFVKTDLDGDSRPDRINASTNGSEVTVLISLSDTSRHTAIAFPSTAPQIGLLALDVDCDGDIDLLVTNPLTQRSIAICLNRGDGTFDLDLIESQLKPGALQPTPMPRDSVVAAASAFPGQRQGQGAGPICDRAVCAGSDSRAIREITSRAKLPRDRFHRFHNRGPPTIQS